MCTCVKDTSPNATQCETVDCDTQMGVEIDIDCSANDSGDSSATGLFAGATFVAAAVLLF